MKYQSTLKNSLDKVLVKEKGQQVLVDDLLKSLDMYFPAATTNRAELLREISITLKTKAEHKGKGRKV